jgi:hypothetical protein
MARKSNPKASSEPTGSRLDDLVGRWAQQAGIEPARVPAPAALAALAENRRLSLRPGADPSEIAGWETRHGFKLPPGLKAWLVLSNGLYVNGPLIHPISAIGPMVPFARVPELMIQPESWFELGNPNVETVCLDLAYRWPGAGAPIFTSGDDLTRSRPRVIAPSFEDWFLELLRNSGREYWFEPEFRDLGDPWEAHRRFAPPPTLSDPLRRVADRVALLLHKGADDRAIASTLGLSRGDVETIFRHLQHGRNGTPQR